MLFNKNIILEILQSDFGDEIEAMVDVCVMDLEPAELESIIEYSVDYALLDEIEEMYVSDYEIENEGGRQVVSGILEVKAMISGYSHWDGEEVYVEDGSTGFGIGFVFETDGINHSNLQLEYLY